MTDKKPIWIQIKRYAKNRIGMWATYTTKFFYDSDKDGHISNYVDKKNVDVVPYNEEDLQSELESPEKEIYREIIANDN